MKTRAATKMAEVDNDCRRRGWQRRVPKMKTSIYMTRFSLVIDQDALISSHEGWKWSSF